MNNRRSVAAAAVYEISTSSDLSKPLTPAAPTTVPPMRIGAPPCICSKIHQDLTTGYTKPFQTGQLNLGDQFNFLTGAFLATSPETSLRAVLQENFVQSIRFQDVTIRGSDTVQSILTFGASSILGRGVLVDLQVGIGLTTFAPKYTVILSGTYRFGTGL